jgi:hypothetical protein
MIGKMGLKRSITRDIEAAGCHISHVIIFARNGTNGERACLQGMLERCI